VERCGSVDQFVGLSMLQTPLAAAAAPLMLSTSPAQSSQTPIPGE